MGAKLLLENEQRLAKRQWENSSGPKRIGSSGIVGYGVGEAKDTLGLIRPLGEARWLVVPALCLQQRPQQIQRLEILGWTTTHGRDRAGLGIRSRARTIGGAPRQRVIMLTPHDGRVGGIIDSGGKHCLGGTAIRTWHNIVDQRRYSRVWSGNFRRSWNT